MATVRTSLFTLISFLFFVTSAFAQGHPDIVVRGDITELSSGSITVESVQFDINEDTDYVDENENEATISRFSVGDFVHVGGNFTNDGLVARRVELRHDHLPPPGSVPPGNGDDECPEGHESCEDNDDDDDDDEECFQDDESCEEAHDPILHIEGTIQEIEGLTLKMHNKVFNITEQTHFRDEEFQPIPLSGLNVNDRIELIVRESQSNLALKIQRLNERDFVEGGPSDGDDLSGPPAAAEAIGAIQSLSGNVIRVLNKEYKITEFTRIEAHGGRPASLEDLREGLIVRVDGIDHEFDEEEDEVCNREDEECQEEVQSRVVGPQLARRIEVAPQEGDTVKIRGPIGLIIDEDITVRGVTARFVQNSVIKGKDGQTISKTELRSGMLVKMLIEVADDATLRAREVRVEGHVVRPDFDNDGEFEKVVYRPEIGMWFIHYGTDQDEDGEVDVESHAWGLPNDIPILMEIDGDGRNEIAVYRPETGQWFVRLSTSGYKLVRTIQWGLPGDLPVPGDYDCDGITDVGVFRPGFGIWYILLSSGNDRDGALEGDPEYILTRQWGLPNHLPIAGADRDGDCRDDIVVWDKDTGLYHTLYSSSGYNRTAALGGNMSAGDSIQFGLPGDDPLVGDFDGDGKDDLSVFREGEWYINFSTGTPTFAVRWGLPGDIPSVLAPTLEDDDQRAGLSVYRPSIGTHFDINSAGDTDVTQWGLPTDKPVGNKKRTDNEE